ncbi:MAG: putative peptidoglycan glycosyltransferase FtsW [Betaproteobacteria bacterium]|nr:putative peptidoglycan glycosyltransferase FtsW [Betaproteobacteria bacterium]
MKFMRLDGLRVQAVRPDAAGLDFWLLALVGALAGCGLMAIFSATITRSDGGIVNPFFIRQFVYALCGCAAGFLLWRFVSLRVLRDRSLIPALAALVALAAAAIDGIGIAVNGAHRWLAIGPVTVQPIEFAKPVLIIYFCAYCAANRDSLASFRQLLPILAVFALACLALLAQPDLGSAVLLGAVLVVILFLAGARLAHFALLFGTGLVLVAVAVLAAPYRMRRLLAFVDPFSDAQGGGYQQVQSLIAFGSGGVTGKGLGLSVGKWSHLPEAHTDFIASVLAEELGLLGIAALLMLFAMVMHIGFIAAPLGAGSGDFFSALLARAIAVLLVLQVFINLGGNLSLLPVKGLTLPLLSFGGSSLVAWLLTLTLLLMIRRENFLYQSTHRTTT